MVKLVLRQYEVIYGLGSWAKWVIVLLGDLLKIYWSSGEHPFQSSHDDGFQSLWTLNPWPATDRAGLTLSQDPSSRLAFTELWILSKLGVRLIGGVIIKLTRGVGELTWCLSQTGCCLVLAMGHLGGLLFSSRCFYTEDSFTGHSGQYCGNVLAVSIPVFF